MKFFIEGIVLGFAIAAPVGPIGVLCIRRTMQYGRLSGIFSGLGAAVADMFYGAIAVFGLDLLSDFLLEWQFWLRVCGGIFLVVWGFRIFISKPKEKTNSATHAGLLKDFVSTFLLTLSNPLTIITFLAIFAGLGLVKNVTHHGIFLILGIFLGSCIWWLILCEGMTFIRKRVSHNFMTWVNRVAGLIIIGFGTAAFFSSTFHEPKALNPPPIPNNRLEK